MKRIHFIAIGGSAMHGLAITLSQKGYHITGSDDEIYDPSRSMLNNAGLLPEKVGWFPEKINADIDAIILGMHARIDNPELEKARQLNIPIYSYPSFVASESESKKRVVVAGSHGKTTTTSMIMTALAASGQKYDYLVGARLPGYQNMVEISDAPLIVIEGDEYLSSPIDRRPKIHHYHPHITILTGIAWDHINVFPTYENYKEQFKIYIDSIVEGGVLIYNAADPDVTEVVQDRRADIQAIPYTGLSLDGNNHVTYNGSTYTSAIIGKHNYQNMAAALQCCLSLGISEKAFFSAMVDFSGAAKRLQLIDQSSDYGAYLDFAHAPSKVAATTEAVKEWYNQRKLLAVLELHTFSSLNAEFINQYQGSMESADEAWVYIDDHTLAMKKMSVLEEDQILQAFNHRNLTIIRSRPALESKLREINKNGLTVLMMTSGTFKGLPLKDFLCKE